jgi:hypothetical protein
MKTLKTEQFRTATNLVDFVNSSTVIAIEIVSISETYQPQYGNHYTLFYYQPTFNPTPVQIN